MVHIHAENASAKQKIQRSKKAGRLQARLCYVRFKFAELYLLLHVLFHS